MTWGELYARVVFKVWGASTPVAGWITVITGSEGVIANAHRRIMQDYNYWFMHEETAYEMVDGTQGYTLPTDYKQDVIALFKVIDKDYFKRPLIKIGIKEGQERYWQSMVQVDYPDKYEIAGDSIIVYPPPNVDDDDTLELHFEYWKFLSRPASTFDGAGGAGDAGYDDLTTYGAEGIVNLAAQEILESQKEFQQAQVYRVMAERAIFALQLEDKGRRQSNLDKIMYKDY